MYKRQEGDLTIGEVLLNPTMIYVDPVINLVLACRDGSGPCESEDIKAIAHITGGGLSNLLRLHDTLGWHIDEPMPVHPEFSWIAEVGSVKSREMHRTFNMGMGMLVAVSKEVSDDVAVWLSNRLPGTRKVGSVTDSGKVTHADSGVFFDHY